MEKEMKAVAKKTTQKEAKFLRDLQAEYSKAYSNAYRELRDILDKMPGGKLNAVEMQKYNRLEKLTKNIQDELNRVGSMQTNQLKTFLKDAYEINYYNTGYAIDKTLGIKTGFSAVDRKQVGAMINNPLLNIAIADNKAKVKMDISRTLAQAVANGDGIQATAKKLKDRIDVSLSRATRIARTETTKTMAKARIDGMKRASDAGIKIQKEWVATLDERTRESHAEVDGEKVDLDKNFSNGLSQPDEVNCRCSITAYFPDYSRDRKDDYKYANYEDWAKQNHI